jgi:hypothetical protein
MIIDLKVTGTTDNTALGTGNTGNINESGALE